MPWAVSVKTRGTKETSDEQRREDTVLALAGHVWERWVHEITQ